MPSSEVSNGSLAQFIFYCYWVRQPPRVLVIWNSNDSTFFDPQSAGDTLCHMHALAGKSFENLRAFGCFKTDARRWILSYACYSEMLNFIDYFSSFFSLLFSTFFLLTRETTFPAIWMTWSYYQSYSFRQKENLWVKLHPVEARFCMMAIHRGLRSTLSKAYPLVTPGKPLPHTNKMLVELSHVSWCHIKIMNADHATRFLPFRPALLLSHFTLVSFRITLVLFALALSVYFVFCFLCQILRGNIEHCSGNLFQISFKH